jgi:hypothetical protein
LLDDEPIDSKLKEDSDVTTLLKSYENRSYSLYITPTLAALIATAA